MLFENFKNRKKKFVLIRTIVFQGICLRSHSKKCTWSKNAPLLTCMRNLTESNNNHHQRKQQPPQINNNNKQHTISLWSG